MTSHYSFVAPGTFLGVRPLFLPDGQVAGNPELVGFVKTVQSMRGQAAAQRIAALDAGLEGLRTRLTPRLIHHYQLVNQSHHVDLTIGDRTYEIELWWPKNLPNTGPDNLAKPCCGIFVMRDNTGVIHLRVGYQPGALLIDANDPQMPLALVVHQTQKHPITQTIAKVDVNIYADPPQSNRISGNSAIIRGDNPAENTELDEPLRFVCGVFANPTAAPADFAENLPFILQGMPDGVARIAYRVRGAR